MLQIEELQAQFTVTSSDPDPCQCTGGILFTPPPSAGNYSFILLDEDDNVINQGENINGPSAVSNLCPTVFHMIVTLSDGSLQDHYFNIPAGAMNIGIATTTNVCLETLIGLGATFNLATELSGFDMSATWRNPDGLIIPAASLSAMTINAVQNGQVDVVLDNGWYTASILSGGCEVTSGIYVQTNDVGLGTTYVICDSYEPFDMTDFMQGTPDTIGTWFNSSNAVVPGGIFDPETMNSELFTYVIDNLDGCGTVFRSMFVSEQVQRSAGGDSTILVCTGGPAFNMLDYLQGSPDDDSPNINNDGYWSLPAGGNLLPLGNDMFNPAAMMAGVYTYITNSAAPCTTNSAQLTITFTNDNPSGLSASYTLCSSDGSFNMLNQLGGNPLPGGTWTNLSTGLEVDQTFNPATEPAGNYSYFYPNVGCAPGSSTLSITVEAPKNAGNNSTAILCETDNNFNLNSLLSQNATGGGSWELAGNTISNLFTPDQTGQVQVLYQVDGIECPDDEALFTLTIQPAAPDPINQTIYLCSLQDPVELTDYFPGMPGVYFETSGGALVSSSFDPESLPSSTYYVINPSTNACPDQEGSLVIEVVYPLIENGTSSVELCRGTALFNLNSTIPPQAVGQGNWTDASGNPSGNMVPSDFTGMASYSYTVVQPITCGGEQRTIELISFDPNDAGPDDSAIFCYTDNPSALVDLLPGAAQNNGEWYFNGTVFPATFFDPGENSSGNYIYRLPPNGPCPADEAVLALTVQQGINYSAGNDVHVCAGSPAQPLGAPASQGTTYSWSPSSGLSNSSVAQPMVNIPGAVSQTTSITYSVFADDGVCTFNDFVDVIIEPNPVLQLDDVYNICFGDILTFNTTGDASYQWTPVNLFDDANSSNPDIQPSATVYVSVEAQSDFGCTTNHQSLVVVNPLPILVLNPETVVGCPPVEIYLEPDTASRNIDNIVWTIPNFGTFFGDSLDVALRPAGIYDVLATAISPMNCVSNYQFEDVAEVFPEPNAAFTISPMELTTLEPEAEFNNTSFGAINYQWQFDEYGTSQEEEPVFSFPNERSANFRICLEVGNEFGCLDTSCRNLFMDAEYVVFAPNAFTPDNDGDNDEWRPVIRGFNTDVYELTIFNRWGDAVFQTNDPMDAWTGDYRGGSYFGNNEAYNWRLKLRKEFTAEDIIFQGNVILIR